MVDTAITIKVPHGNQLNRVLHYYSNAALTASTSIREWVIPAYYRILQVIVDSETTNIGAGVDRIDVNVNGTSIYSATADKPYLTPGDTGQWKSSDNYVTQDLVPGDVVSFDVDNIATTGSARVKVNIVLGPR